MYINVYKFVGDENAFYYKVVPWVIQVLGSTCMYDPYNKFVVKSILSSIDFYSYFSSLIRAIWRSLPLFYYI